MMKEIEQKDLAACVTVIRDSFATVAEEFNITEKNAPRFTAFATDERRLYWHLNGEHRPMFGYYIDDKIVGYYSLLLMENSILLSRRHILQKLHWLKHWKNWELDDQVLMRRQLPPSLRDAMWQKKERIFISQSLVKS